MTHKSHLDQAVYASGSEARSAYISEFVVQPFGKMPAQVIEWLDSTDEELIFLSVLTIGEIRKGINLHSDAARRAKLEAFLASDIRERFEGRILPIDDAIAERWGLLAARAKTGNNHILPVVDGLLAATAQHHDLTLVTRNVGDVPPTGVPLFNPWA